MGFLTVGVCFYKEGINCVLGSSLAGIVYV